MRIEGESTKGPSEARHLLKKFFWMGVLGKKKMPERAQGGINSMQKPELGNLSGRHPCLKCSLLPLSRNRDSRTFFLEDLHLPPQYFRQPLACAEFHTGGNKTGVQCKASRRVTHDSCHGQAHKIVVSF